VNVSEELLCENFAKRYSSVIAAKLIIDPISKVSKGYGFIKFKNLEESENAKKEMNGKYILNKAIKTNQAMWKKYSQDLGKSKISNVNRIQDLNNCSNNYYNKNLSNINKLILVPMDIKNYSNNNFSNNNVNINSQLINNVNSPLLNFEKGNNNTDIDSSSITNVEKYLQSLYQKHYLNNSTNDNNYYYNYNIYNSNPNFQMNNNLIDVPNPNIKNNFSSNHYQSTEGNSHGNSFVDSNN